MAHFPKGERHYYNQRLGELDNERSSFISHWRDLSDFTAPRRGRFTPSDRNKGHKRRQNIINGVASHALKTATSGMLAGTMSPARPWFNVETQDPLLMEDFQVKTWLAKVDIILRAILNQSNFYSQIQNTLKEMLLFGTGCLFHVDDFQDVARFYAQTAGAYFIAQNDRFTVDTMYREFQWTAGQVINSFGIDNVSERVKRQARDGNYDSWVDVVHAIEPNNDFRPSSPFAKNLPFKSVYYEKGLNSHDPELWLSRSGFHEFPVYAPRWDVTAEDIYGTDCPGMTALDDIRQLQIQEKRKAQGIDKMVNPPLTGPASVRNVPVSALPGGLTIYDGSGGDQKLAPLYTVNPQLQELRLDMDAVEKRIEQFFFVDLFFAITNIEGIQPRNQLDLMQRNEERLLQLGPVLERMQSELQNPLIDRLFNQAVRAGILPPPPGILQGKALNVKYISTLAMAQRAVAAGGIERLATFTGNLVQLGFENAAKKFNSEQAVDEMARAIGAPPTIVVPDEEVAQQKADEARAQAAAAQLEAIQSATSSAKNAADAKLGDENALTEVLG